MFSSLYFHRQCLKTKQRTIFLLIFWTNNWHKFGTRNSFSLFCESWHGSRRTKISHSHCIFLELSTTHKHRKVCSSQFILFRFCSHEFPFFFLRPKTNDGEEQRKVSFLYFPKKLCLMSKIFVLQNSSDICSFFLANKENVVSETIRRQWLGIIEVVKV